MINTKRGDSEVTLIVNMDLTNSTVRVLARVRRSGDPFTILDSTVVDAASGTLTADSSELAVGVYDMEVEVTQGGRVYTFPDVGYATLAVTQDLG